MLACVTAASALLTLACSGGSGDGYPALDAITLEDLGDDYQFDIAHDASDALTKLEQNNYALLITDLDPLRYSLLFERFLNPERVSMPDIDIDDLGDLRDDAAELPREGMIKDLPDRLIEAEAGITWWADARIEPKAYDAEGARKLASFGSLLISMGMLMLPPVLPPMCIPTQVAWRSTSPPTGPTGAWSTPRRCWP